MRLRNFIAGVLLLATGRGVQADGLAAARRAQALLGPDHWAEVVRLASSGHGAGTRYALVFELEARLWYFEDGEGTQSLSLERGRLERDKADLGPLLHEIDPRIGRYEVVASPPAAGPTAGAALAQGCFIECIAYLRQLSASGQPPDEARLVAYYGGPESGVRGHTVLYFRRGTERFLFDPAARTALKRVPARVRGDSLALARFAAPLGGHPPPARAVFLPLHVPPADRGWHPAAVVAQGPGGGASRSAGIN